MTTTEQKWIERVRVWRESGLSAREFSTGRDFAVSSLRQWSSRLRRRDEVRSRPGAPVRVRFARVEREPLAATAVVTVEVGDARVSIPPGADVTTVRAVLGALRGDARCAR